MKRLAGGLIFLLILGAILFINYYPHYYASLKTPPNYAYSGQASWFDPWDINNYFATIKLAQKENSLLLDNLNTTEPVKGGLIYPLYTATGVLFPKVDGLLLYHSLAIICGILLACGIYILSYLLTKKASYSLYALLLIALGGGFGFLFPTVGADLNIPGVTFFSNFQKPHEALAALLYTSSLVSFYLAIKKRNKYYWLISVLTLILLIPIYPYRVLSFLLIAGVFVLIAGGMAKKKYPYLYLGTFSLMVLPLTLMYVFHFLSSGFAALTGYTPLPISPVSLLLGYGLFLVLYAYQLFFVNKKGLLGIFLNIWVMVSLGLSLLPFGMSRLYLSGLLFPLTILFILSLNKLSAHLRMPIIFIMVIAALVALPSSLYTFSKRTAEVKNNNLWYYLPGSINQGLDFLGKSEKDGVLVLPPLSSFVPAHSVKHVYFGLQDQTPDYANRVNRAIFFYSGKLTEKEAKTFLKDNHINFVVVSDQERQFGKLPYSFLASVYKNKSVEIFSY